jgi:tripartite-type tricarboxylate transporter receptor subunit TctC
MNKLFCVFTVLTVCGTLLVANTNAQQADNYPNRPVRIICPYPPGGAVDFSARVAADVLQKTFGQSFTVENRSGGAGNPGAEAVALAPPDGYTLLATPPQILTIQDILFKKLSYDPSGFEPVAIVVVSPNVIMVRNDHPAKTLSDLIAHIKANPGKVVYASQGNGTTTHLTTALLEHRIGTKMIHVPYRGTAPAISDLIGGHVEMMFVDLGSGLAQHRSGNTRILAVASEERSASAPEIPTVSEAGIPNFVSSTWISLAAPPKTPAAIIAKLNKAIVNGLNAPEVQNRYRALHYAASQANQQEIAAHIKSERQLWGEVIRTANISVE